MAGIKGHTGIYKRSKELKKKLKKHFLKINKKTRFKKGYISWNKNIPCFEQTKQKIKNSKYHTNIKMTKEHKNKIKISMKKYCSSKEYRKSMSLRFGGTGIPYENNEYPLKWTETLKESIRQRDNYICQKCGKKQSELKGRFRKLDIHHIDYNKENLDPNNLISLCHRCNIRVNGNRDYYYAYFTYIMELKNVYN